MPRNTIKFALRIRPETQELVRAWYRKDNCKSQSEFIEKAIFFMWSIWPLKTAQSSFHPRWYLPCAQQSRAAKAASPV